MPATKMGFSVSIQSQITSVCWPSNKIQAQRQKLYHYQKISEWRLNLNNRKSKPNAACVQLATCGHQAQHLCSGVM